MADGGIFLAEPWKELARARTGANDELVLRRRGEMFEIRCNGAELMANRAHHSEETLALLACRGLSGSAPRALVGGLGMGYTLRAALDALPGEAEVVVAEALPEVVAWNRGPLAALAGRPLDDPRVRMACGDVADILRQTAGGFDAIMLDVDNGPEALSLPANSALYSAGGLAAIRRALRPGGAFALWSADRSLAFERRLDAAGLVWRVETVPARGLEGDPDHAIYVVRLSQP